MFVLLEILLESQINHAGNTLLTNTHEIIYPLGQRGEKPYPVQRHIPVVYRPYKGVPTRVRNQPKRFSEATGLVFWVSIPTGPTRGYRNFTQLSSACCRYSRTGSPQNKESSNLATTTATVAKTSFLKNEFAFFQTLSRLFQLV